MTLTTQTAPYPAISLAGAVAVVTGAGSQSAHPEDPLGIGAATAIQFASAGASVVLVDRDTAAAARTVSLINYFVDNASVERRLLVVPADVTNEKDTVSIATQTAEAFGPVSALVNNVGVAGPRGTAVDLDLDGWADAMAINVGSMLLMSRAVLPQMIRAGAGSIINMSSVAGIRGGHHSLSYPTTKAAVVGLSMTMAAHHGPQGIRVNTLVPGLAYTPMVTSRGLSEPDRKARGAAGMLKSEGLAWDIASAACFLASDAARWITGTTIPVDGGLSSLSNNLGVARRDG